MILCRVKGEVVATIKHPAYNNWRMLFLDRIDPGGKETGAYLIALDAVDADLGQTVLVIDEGNSARQVVGDPQAPIRSVIIGIVDEIAVTAS
ncbi:MAG TPA: EutN/CcmL family microcompartment protein [Phycisphaerae bacterium]|nr:EutN/CcmL family microcompartment protein [Phycisphaerae bacterium]